MDTENLKIEVEALKREVFELRNLLNEHRHNGIQGGLVSFNDIFDTIKTVTSSTDLTNILASTPRKISEQILIDTTTGTKKLYIYDMIGGVWRSVAIA